MKDDYYFDYVNAVVRLSGAKYVIESLLKAVDSNDSVTKTVAVKLAESEIIEILKVLNREGDSA